MKNTVTNVRSARTNEELESLYQKPNIVEVIRNKRLQWARHALGKTEKKTERCSREIQVEKQEKKNNNFVTSGVSEGGGWKLGVIHHIGLKIQNFTSNLYVFIIILSVKLWGTFDSFNRNYSRCWIRV